LAKASEQFRQSDVTLWGIVALACAGLAVFGANVSALVPQGMLAGLHKTRLEGPSLDSLRQQVADLREQTVRLRRENELLVSRFALQERAGNEIVRRVGALEVSVPRLLEALPAGAEIDRSSLTASIGGNGTLSFDADGGSVVVRQTPMPQAAAGDPVTQPLPPPVEAAPLVAAATPNEDAYGIAIGPAIAFEQAQAQWSDLTLKLGPLLFGLSPLLVDETNGEGKRIVVGPISALAEATALCRRLEGISIACMPMPFTGEPLGPSAAGTAQ